MVNVKGNLSLSELCDVSCEIPVEHSKFPSFALARGGFLTAFTDMVPV